MNYVTGVSKMLDEWSQSNNLVMSYKTVTVFV